MHLCCEENWCVTIIVSPLVDMTAALAHCIITLFLTHKPNLVKGFQLKSRPVRWWATPPMPKFEETRPLNQQLLVTCKSIPHQLVSHKGCCDGYLTTSKYSKELCPLSG